jgi:hypothetical protein
MITKAELDMDDIRCREAFLRELREIKLRPSLELFERALIRAFDKYYDDQRKQRAAPTAPPSATQER